jgi:tRNA pseudouridine55 synthase
LHGVLVIDKPAGLTSHDVVARVRRLTGESRVGHAGTLDPAATGVLPVCVGQATRLVEYLSAADKVYLAEVVLGARSNSDDLDGELIATSPAPPLTEAELDAVLGRFRGPIQQLPPAYAAIKVDGRRLYDIARAGQEVEIPIRDVTIHRLDLLAWRPPALTLLVECSKGTYIRSLARDIGAAIGCGGYVQALRRIRTGPFCLADALALDALAERDLPATWAETALRLDSFLLDWPALRLDAVAGRVWLNGGAVVGAALPDGTLARVYADDGRFLGVGRYDGALERWRPEKVLSYAGTGGR